MDSALQAAARAVFQRGVDAAAVLVETDQRLAPDDNSGHNGRRRKRQQLPEDLRVAYRILRNAGFVPPELEARREAADLRRLLAAATDDGERKHAAAKLALIEAALEAGGRGRLPRGDDYRERIVAKLDRPR
jgi:hypothetical protein